MWGNVLSNIQWKYDKSAKKQVILRNERFKLSRKQDKTLNIHVLLGTFKLETQREEIDQLLKGHFITGGENQSTPI